MLNITIYQMRESMKLKIGDRVSWESQSAGYWKKKKGVVAEIVPIRGNPSPGAFPSLHRWSGCGLGRNHVSYVIVCGPCGGKVYWPRVSALKKEAK